MVTSVKASEGKETKEDSTISEVSCLWRVEEGSASLAVYFKNDLIMTVCKHRHLLGRGPPIRIFHHKDYVKNKVFIPVMDRVSLLGEIRYLSIDKESLV